APPETQTIADPNLRDATREVAARLGNTPTICRKCYVHPQVLNCYLDGSLARRLEKIGAAASGDSRDGLRPEEAVALALLRSGGAADANARESATSGPARSTERATRREQASMRRVSATPRSPP